MQDLTDLEREVLGFAGLRWNAGSARETAIRQQFDMSALRYEQTLNALIERSEPYLHDPPLVKGLRRLHDDRRQRRAG